MKYHFFSTLCNSADNFIDTTLDQLSKDEITLEQAFKNLQKIESYDENEKPYFPDADMTTETKHEFVENICAIKNMDEDSVWDVYDKVYELFYNVLDRINEVGITNLTPDEREIFEHK